MLMASKGRVLLPLILFLFPLFIESRSPPFSPSHHYHHHHEAFGFIKNLVGCHKGQTAKHLHKLKRYLENFGYLPPRSTITNPNSNNNVGNEDDSFDESLESAVKLYQLNFHLNVTGMLDVATAKQMMKPRCGVPDAFNGTSSMRSGGKGRHLGSYHFHVVSHFSFFPDAPKWPPSKTNLTYGLLQGVPVIDVEELRSVYKSAFEKWRAVSNFTFEEVQNVDSADIKIGFFREGQGDDLPFDGAGGVLAHSFAPSVGLLHFDADEKWAVNASANTFDVESVAVHEIGHVLGLGHSDVQNAIMFPSIGPGVKKVSLDKDDIDGIRALYSSR